MNTELDYPLQVALLERKLKTEQRQSVTAPPSERFMKAARAAAHRAAGLRRLESMSQSAGFRALPLPDYLAWLAKLGQVTLSELLPTAKSGVVSAFADLARQIAMPFERIQLLTRAFVAARVAPISALSRSISAADDRLPFPVELTEEQLRLALDQMESFYGEDEKINLEAALQDADCS